jgi:glycosyltransferase involved in cell wall biosynthesis
MISVCMAVKNGERFLRQQIDSILHQLGEVDELVISDDYSTDDTVSIIQSYFDARIVLINNKGKGILKNFETALSVCRGEFIFLTDQDDVWMPQRITKTIPYLNQYDLVVNDCKIVNSQLYVLHESFFDFNQSGKGFLKNLFRNSYMGCCMAFKRVLLTKALPFPSRIIMHDQWLGLVGELDFTIVFIPDKLVWHRRHEHNASTTFYKSRYHIVDKFSHRLQLAWSLAETRYEN